MAAAARPPSVLFDAATIRRRVAELGVEIAADHAGDDLLLVSVLRGGAIFLADLIREIRLPLAVDFMAISAFGNDDEAGGRVRILKDLDEPIGGRHVLVVEDIVDTGLTLAYLRAVLLARGPADVEVCTLLDRRVRRIAPVDIRYVGFECPDTFVVGYGLDIDQRYRNLPDILAVEDVAAVQADPAALEPFLRAGAPPVAGDGLPT